METQNKPSSKQEAISSVIFFELINGKYLASNGYEITTEMLIANKHFIEDDKGYVVLDKYSGNNFGWIKIESEKDLKELPKTYQSYHGAFNEFIYDTTFNYQTLLKKYAEKELTHYQPIIKPNLPIY